jgi:tetrahydromethanopterin S-methyltransferase subunit D
MGILVFIWGVFCVVDTNCAVTSQKITKRTKAQKIAPGSSGTDLFTACLPQVPWFFVSFVSFWLHQQWLVVLID